MFILEQKQFHSCLIESSVLLRKWHQQNFTWGLELGSVRKNMWRVSFFFRNADEISFIFSEAVLSFFFSFVNWTHRCKTRVKVNSFGQAGFLRQAKAAPLLRSLVFREVRTNSVANAFSSKDSPNWVDHWRHATTSSPRIPRHVCDCRPGQAERLERGYHSDAPRTWESEIWLLYTPDSWNVCDDEAGELRALLKVHSISWVQTHDGAGVCGDGGELLKTGDFVPQHTHDWQPNVEDLMELSSTSLSTVFRFIEKRLPSQASKTCI